MGIRKSITAYNGTVCEFHSIVNFTLNQDGTCAIAVGAFTDPMRAKHRLAPEEIVTIEASGISAGGDMLGKLYPKVIDDARFSGGEQF